MRGHLPAPNFVQTRMKHAPPLRLSVVTLVLFACFAASGAHAANPTSHFVKGPTPEHKNLVIFVHGVLGDSEGTWTNPENHAYWPKLVSEDPDFSEMGYLLDATNPKM